MKSIVYFVKLICIAGILQFASAESEITLEQLIENHTKAIGGKAAIEKVKSIEFKLQIEEPTFNVNGVYRADRKKLMRIDIYQDAKWVFAEGYDGQKGWQLKTENGQAEESSEEGSAALWHGIVQPGKLFGLHEAESIGSKVALEGRERLEGINYYAIKLTLSDGYSLFYYIHPETWRIERSRDFKALHPDVDPTKKQFETRYSDFRMQDDVLWSYRSEKFDLQTGEKVQTTKIQSLKPNPDLDLKIFEMK